MAKENLNVDDAKASSTSRYIIAGIFSVLAAILYYFWAVPYRAALSYREQQQLFQTTSEYFNSLAARPGGVATYVGEFLTQFFNNFWIGAAVMTALLLLFLLLNYLITTIFTSKSSETINTLRKAHSPSLFTLNISLLSFLALFLFLGNPIVTLNFIVALTITLAGTCLILSAKKMPAVYAMMIILTTLLYWLAGATTIVFTLLIIAFICTKKHTPFIHKAIFAVLSLAVLAANIYVWSSYLPYPISYQLIGIGYTMIPDRLDLLQVVVEALCILVPIIAIFLTRLPQKVMVPSLIAAEIIAIVILYPKAYDKTTYQLIDYDYMVRANDWNGILSYSDKHDPNLPLSVCATNLAAGMTGQLDSRAFNYFQHGTEGLIPPFSKETLSSWTTGEIFFQLGMINSAQRFYFEGMEAIPNYNKSSRAIRRMAETAIVRGDYTLAKKYLTMLKNTIFYKKWAQRNLDLIKNPEAVDNHPLYGTLRKKMIDENYLFSEAEVDKTIGQLFLKDPGNNLAKQYLILYPLLQRDLNKFAQYMGVVVESQPKYNPLLAQQAVAFISMKNGQPIPQNMVPPAVEQSLRNFTQAWVSKDPSRIEPHRRSLYYYLLSD